METVLKLAGEKKYVALAYGPGQGLQIARRGPENGGQRGSQWGPKMGRGGGLRGGGSVGPEYIASGPIHRAPSGYIKVTVIVTVINSCIL